MPHFPPPAPEHSSRPGRHNHRPPRHVGRFFFRFALTLAVMAMLVLGGMAAFAYVLVTWLGGEPGGALAVWTFGCGLTVGLPLLAALLARRTFRRTLSPLSDVMAGINAVADGDLEIRVEERGGPDVRRLASSFNGMVDALARSEQQRRNLTADVAHELRTPLHIIQGNLEGVLDGVYAPTQEHLAATLEETQLLARLVEDLQTLSLAESGALPLRRETVDPAALLADVQTSFGGQAAATGITLTVECAAAPLIVGDEDRLNQVLSILVTNGLRHTPAGGRIVLRAHAAGERLRLQVEDDGEGIPDEQLPYVFDRFYRGDAARRRDEGSGSGLGLAIARQLVLAHGGEIAVESVATRGTRFSIWLPAGSAARAPNAATL